MNETTDRPVRIKPAKPYPEFPLFPHATGRWAKKIRGKFVFFGKWEDWQGALGRYYRDREALHAGLEIPAPVQVVAVRAASGRVAPAVRSGPTLRELANAFLDAKERRMESGEMTRRSFADFHATARRLLSILDPDRPAATLTPADFAHVRATLAEKRGPVSLGNELIRIRSLFKYGYDAALLDSPVRFGPEFKGPSPRALRLARQSQGARMFERAEIQALLDQASAPMAAMILLGINCGLGNTDVGALKFAHLDLKKGVLEFPRPKSGIRRRAFLWPETVKALREAIKARPKPKDESDAEFVFLTGEGHRWVRVDPPRSGDRHQAVIKDGVALRFARLRAKVGLDKANCGFYALRHTFRTVADELADRRAVDLIMGHEDGSDMSGRYVERISDDRLQRVAEHVRAWMFHTPKSPSPRR